VQDDRRFESRQKLGIFLFTTASRSALGPTQPPIQRVIVALSLTVKRPGHDADHPPTFSAEVKNAWSYIYTLPIILHGVVFKCRLLFILYNVTQTGHRSSEKQLLYYRSVGEKRMTTLRWNSSTRLEGLRNTREDFNKDSLSVGPELKLGISEFQSLHHNVRYTIFFSTFRKNKAFLDPHYRDTCVFNCERALIA
jgi:hypothetical protein